MTRAAIDANHLVDRYVQGELSGSERESFEIYMLEHPDIADDVEFARSFVAAVKESDELREQYASSKSRPAYSPFWKPVAIAAMFLLAISLSLVGYILGAADPRSSELRFSESPVQVDDSEILEVLRGRSLPAIELRPGRSVLIEADVAGDPSATYAFELRNADGSFVMQRSGLLAEDGLLAVQLVDPPQGRYSLRITASADTTVVAEYRFDLVVRQR